MVSSLLWKLIKPHIPSRAHERNVNYDNTNLISLQNQFRFSVVAGVSAVNIENGFSDLLVSVHCCYKCHWTLY